MPTLDEMVNNVFLRLGDLSLTASRYCQSLFNRPPVQQSPAKRVLIDADLLSPFRKTERLVVKGDKFIVARVSSLLFGCSPSRILRFVVSVLVGKPINRMSRRWWLSHIFKKVLKGLKPPCAHINSAPAVIGIILVAGIQTAVSHPAPRFISSVAMGIAMLFVYAFMQATAGAGSFLVGSDKLRSGDKYELATITFTQPIRRASKNACKPNTVQPPKTSTGRVMLNFSLSWREAPNLNRLSISHRLNDPFRHWLDWGGRYPRPLQSVEVL